MGIAMRKAGLLKNSKVCGKPDPLKIIKACLLLKKGFVPSVFQRQLLVPIFFRSKAKLCRKKNKLSAAGLEEKKSAVVAGF